MEGLNATTARGKCIESLLVEFHDIFGRHRFEIGFNEKDTVKLTPDDDSPAYSQSSPTPVNLKEDVLVELASLHKDGIITTLSFLNTPAPYLRSKNPMRTSDY